MVRAVMMVDPEWLADRRSRGIDRWDEVWDGVLHVPPEPSTDHQRVEQRLALTLAPHAKARGLELLWQISILQPGHHAKNYRTPDIVVIDPARLIRRGTEGPVELAIEILSPFDETRDKLPFYAARGVGELWIVEPDTRAVEVYLLRNGTYAAVVADRSGVVRAPALDLELATLPGPILRITSAAAAADI